MDTVTFERMHDAFAMSCCSKFRLQLSIRDRKVVFGKQGDALFDYGIQIIANITFVDSANFG